ncbi:amino acid deaminase/aldolase [soil metagenome]
MSNFERTYSYYRDIFKGTSFPYAFVDLDLYDENVRQIAKRAGNKTIRIASKSVRCKELLKRTLAADPIYQGIMCYTTLEAVWLSKQGFDDLLIGYPSWDVEQIHEARKEIARGKTIIFMVDLPEHVTHLEAIGKETGVTIPICIDLDMSSDYPGLHFGVWRSKVRSKDDALKLWEVIKTCPHVKLAGLMGYEAQIAGVGDNWPGKTAMNTVVRYLKKRSVKEIAKRRGDTVQALIDAGADMKLINGGGTGSLEWTIQEPWVTEVTVGSGLYNSGLFDNYTNFRHYPSAAYAVEVVRHPKPNLFTCHGGGYTASGAAGKDKLPFPYLPTGAKLLDQEGAGEVQTPIVYTGPEQLQLGDPVYLRHSKAGELCERFKELLLVSNGKIVGSTPTYRGEGQCFL